MRNASVFPLPVRAAPSTSLPLRDTGMLDAWISVILTKEHFFNPGRIVNLPGFLFVKSPPTAFRVIGYWQIDESPEAFRQLL